MIRILFILSLFLTAGVARADITTPVPVASCTPILFSITGGGSSGDGSTALIVNADGTFYVDWPRLRRMAKNYSVGNWHNLGELQEWAIIHAVLSSRGVIKTVSLKQAHEIAKLSALRGDCDTTHTSWYSWPIKPFTVKETNK